MVVGIGGLVPGSAREDAASGQEACLDEIRWDMSVNLPMIRS